MALLVLEYPLIALMCRIEENILAEGKRPTFEIHGVVALPALGVGDYAK